MRRFFASLAIAVALASLSPAFGAALSENQALDRLVKLVQRDALYNSWTTMQCLLFTTEAKSRRYIDFAIHEKHDRKCAGDPMVSPIVDRYR
ncbi:MAG: hypothetical protein ACHP7O_07575, partial [Burkholderiales bacterium]